MSDIPDGTLEALVALWAEDMAAERWYGRELYSALKARELTPEMVLETAVILNSPLYHDLATGDVLPVPGYDPDGPEEPTADQYKRSAQLIACRRNTCGGPNGSHEHIN